MRVAVYSGSFDPLHIGHLAIMEALSSMPGIDVTYLVVSPQNPLKEAGKAASAFRRFEAAVDAVSRYPELKVRVDDVEMRMNAPHYSIRTLDVLKQREPDNVFTLVIGADNLADIRRWRDYRRLLSDYGVMVFPRRGYDLEHIIKSLQEEAVSAGLPLFWITLIDAPLVDISSTEIREAVARGCNVSNQLM